MLVQRRFLVIFAVAAALGLCYPASMVGAHGGGVPRLTNAEIGPYWISVWSQPDPLRVGEMHLTVALSEPSGPEAALKEAGPPVLNAAIEVRLRPVGWPGETISAIASHENSANKFLYEADLLVPQAGRWEVTLLVVGPDGSSGSVDFEVEVLPASPLKFSWTLAGVIGVVLLVALMLGRNLRIGRK